MLSILHTAEDFDNVADTISPLLEGKSFELLSYTDDLNIDFQADSIILTYMGDKELKDFLPLAAENEWTVGILPHPENQITSKGLGLSNDLEETIEEILSPKEPQPVDLLFCNGYPVFQSVKIGKVFALTESKPKHSFILEIINFLKSIVQIPYLSHRSFLLSSEDDKIIHTSALGIIAIEHSSGSVISKRLISDSANNDGMFHLLVLAPQNVFSILWFLFKSILPSGMTMRKTPSFIGQLKTSYIKIEDKRDIEFSVDGKLMTSQILEIEVYKDILHLKQKSEYSLEDNGSPDKKSLKIDMLPTGEKREELTRRKLPILPRATAEEFEELFKVLRENAELSSSFVVMMILATLIATFGLFGDSSPVIIGAMILAPIIAPIVSFAMGMVRYDVKMLKKGIGTITIGTLAALIIAAGVSLIIPMQILTSEIDARLTPTLLDMGIAVASGIAAAYAHAKEGIAKSLAGVAIAVALVPPLSVAGIGIGWWNWEVFSGAFLLYLTNLAGIIMFAGITFLLLGFAPFKRAKLGLVYTFIIIALVAIPLTLSFGRIKQEARVTKMLEGTVVENVILRDVKVRFGEPLMISVKLVGPEFVEAKEMQEIKKEIEKKVGYPIVLEIVSAIEF